MGDYKPFKIRGVLKSELTGIAASTLDEVITKGCAKLKMPTPGVRVYLESDGTLVNDEDYFHLLQPETSLVLCEQGKTWKGDISQQIQQIVDKLSKTNCKEEVNKILNSSPCETKSILVHIRRSQRGNIDAENKGEDPAWFKGMNSRFKTKSEVMFAKAQDRVRGYFTKTKDTLKTAKDNFSKESLERYKVVLKELKDSLKANKYHGVYFERTCHHPDRLCNDKGWFECQGRYNMAKCHDYHLINPYSTNDSLILFSSWNLDHVIEKQREVIPRLGEAIQNCPPKKEVNTKYFYELLFTRNNLKLVDICCHDKGVHSGRVLKSKFYRKPVRLPRS